MAKVRIDKYLVENGYFETREKAKRSIMAGIVLVNDEPVFKAGDNFDPNKIKEIRIKGDICPYASRGGLKLKKAIDTFALEFDGKIMLDVGASKGLKGGVLVLRVWNMWSHKNCANVIFWG